MIPAPRRAGPGDRRTPGVRMQATSALPAQPLTVPAVPRQGAAGRTMPPDPMVYTPSSPIAQPANPRGTTANARTPRQMPSPHGACAGIRPTWPR